MKSFVVALIAVSCVVSVSYAQDPYNQLIIQNEVLKSVVSKDAQTILSGFNNNIAQAKALKSQVNDQLQEVITKALFGIAALIPKLQDNSDLQKLYINVQFLAEQLLKDFVLGVGGFTSIEAYYNYILDQLKSILPQ